MIGHLNLLSAVFTSVLAGIGINFPIHLMARYDEARRQGASSAQAVELAVVNTGTVKVSIPVSSFAKNDKGLVIAMTKAGIDAAAQSQAEANEHVRGLMPEMEAERERNEVLAVARLRQRGEQTCDPAVDVVQGQSLGHAGEPARHVAHDAVHVEIPRGYLVGEVDPRVGQRDHVAVLGQQHPSRGHPHQRGQPGVMGEVAELPVYRDEGPRPEQPFHG